MSPNLKSELICFTFFNTDDIIPREGLRNGFSQTPTKKKTSFRGLSTYSSPKGKHLSVPKTVPGVGVVAGSGSHGLRSNGATPKSNNNNNNNNVRHPTIDSAEIDKSLLKNNRAMFYKTSMSDKVPISHL